MAQHSCRTCKYYGSNVSEFPCSDCADGAAPYIPGTVYPVRWTPKQTNEVVVDVQVADNPVTHPHHYTQGGIECIQAMEAAFGKETVAHFCICNAFKYLWRSEHKNGLEDIKKAEWYLNKYKELRYGE